MSDSQSPTHDNSNTNADPLLKPGAFIDPNPSTTSAVDPSDSSRPPHNSAAEGVDATPRPSPGKKRGSEPMDWLPAGWKVETKERTSGATAGLVDKYYYEIATGRRFRSKKEVLSYLQTGDVPKRKRENAKTESLEAKKKSSFQNFDFINAPEDVTWVRKNDSTDTWTAEIGGKEVPESTRQEWAAAKDHVFGSGSDSLS